MAKRAFARACMIPRMLRVYVFVLLVSQVLGHTYFSPLDFLHHERATVQWGESIHRLQMHCCAFVPFVLYIDDSIVIEVNTTELESSGAWINVSWSGVSLPTSDDWIGVYSPPINNTIDPAAHAPVKYQVMGMSNSWCGKA